MKSFWKHFDTMHRFLLVLCVILVALVVVERNEIHNIKEAQVCYE